MNRSVKIFFKNVLRMATAILLVVVVLILGMWGYQWWSSYRENARNAPLEIPRDWPVIKLEGVGSAEASLRTMWRSGRMSYVFEIKKYTGTQSKKEWILEFTDPHGFRVFRHTIRNETITLNDRNEIVGFHARGDMPVSADQYRRAEEWRRAWID
jgi:hypothetical protein